MKGTQWVIKTPRLRCRCGRTVHYENRGKWKIVYDVEPVGADNPFGPSIGPCATPTSTLSTPYDTGEGYPEPPPKAEDDSDG